MRCYSEICESTISSLTVAENAVDLIENEMIYIRNLANEVRLNWWMDRKDMSYAVGSFNGVRFSMLTLINQFGSFRDWREFRDLTECYAAEIAFLSGPYLERRAA